MHAVAVDGGIRWAMQFFPDIFRSARTEQQIGFVRLDPVRKLNVMAIRRVIIDASGELEKEKKSSPKNQTALNRLATAVPSCIDKLARRATNCTTFSRLKSSKQRV